MRTEEGTSSRSRVTPPRVRRHRLLALRFVSFILVLVLVPELRRVHRPGDYVTVRHEGAFRLGVPCHTVVPPAPSLDDIRTWIRDSRPPLRRRRRVAGARRRWGPPLNRTDLYARQQQVVIGEAALLWLELVRPNAAASSTHAPSLETLSFWSASAQVVSRPFSKALGVASESAWSSCLGVEERRRGTAGKGRQRRRRQGHAAGVSFFFFFFRVVVVVEGCEGRRLLAVPPAHRAVAHGVRLVRLVGRRRRLGEPEAQARALLRGSSAPQQRARRGVAGVHQMANAPVGLGGRCNRVVGLVASP